MSNDMSFVASLVISDHIDAILVCIASLKLVVITKLPFKWLFINTSDIVIANSIEGDINCTLIVNRFTLSTQHLIVIITNVKYGDKYYLILIAII